VDSLIDHDLKCWNSELLEQVFLPRDVEIIKQIPLSKRSPSDRLIWTGTSNGNFSVRSAYHLLLHEQERMLESLSRGLGESQQLWSAIWSARVQPKIRVFMWRACLDILPTRTKLFDRGILSSFSCQWCEENPETPSHVLWQCDFAQRVWSACLVPIPHVCHPSLHFRDFISICVQCLSGFNLEILFTMAWEIWNARNRLFWDSKSTTVDDIWTKAAGLATDFMEVGLRVYDLGGPASFSDFSRWRPPDVGIYKLNIGICMSSSSMQVGLRFLIRDAQGFVVAAMQLQVVRCEDELQLQALVVLTTIQFAFDVGLRHLDIKLSFQHLLSLLNSYGSCLAPIGTLVDDILCVKQLFYFCHFSFINILCNKAAMALASEALSSNTTQVWLEECPPCINTLVQADSVV
jgi:hypothetical protein